MTGTTEQPLAARASAATAVAVLAVLGAAGGIAMTVFHVDLYRAGALPLAVPVGFAAGAVAFAAVAFGAWTRARWAWPAAVVVNGLGFVAAVFPWRGPQALAPAAMTALALAVLVSPGGRAALLSRSSRPGGRARARPVRGRGSR
jgi:hypothetical protein